jgi:hypothetical protein
MLTLKFVGHAIGYRMSVIRPSGAKRGVKHEVVGAGIAEQRIVAEAAVLRGH